MPEKQPAIVDVAIVGAGPAGITAALYAARKALSARVFEAEAVGGQVAEAIWVENYPGIPKISGAELMRKMADQLRSFGVEIEEAAEVTGIRKAQGGFELEINSGEEKVSAKTVIICTGSRHVPLGIPGEKKFFGKGVFYCATCDGPLFKDKTVAVIGGGNCGVNAALFFSGICKKTYLIEFMPKPNFDAVYSAPLRKSKVEFLLNTQLTEIIGKESVEQIKVKDRSSGKERAISLDGVFIYIGLQPKSELAKKAGLKVDAKGYVSVGSGKMSSVPGIFAAGDVCGDLAQLAVSVGAGAVAATSAFDYLKKEPG